MSPHLEHLIPSVKPDSSQVAALAGIISSICPKASPSVFPQRLHVFGVVQVASSQL
jgi:hypothetical protein